jgi:L-asparaginase/N4-(beta-N-acetylglucosaminyl)-L-asparaginase
MGGGREAWPALASGGSALDAVCTVAAVAERDEAIDSVGRGGLPDASGRMTLDACVMLGPAHCGAVAGVSRHLAVTRMAHVRHGKAGRQDVGQATTTVWTVARTVR